MKGPFFSLFLVVFAFAAPACSISGNFAQSSADPAHVPSRPDLTVWLEEHPRIAGAIKWQYRPASMTNALAPPLETNKTAWPDWTREQKEELNQAYLRTCRWLHEGAFQAGMDPAGLTDEPVNIHPNAGDDVVTAMQWVAPSYMWKLYIAHVAFSLALELTGRLEWSIAEYDEESLRWLFDSTTMAWNLFDRYYAMGTNSAGVPDMREHNLPRTAFGPPQWTYPFLKEFDLIGPSRIDTIARVLDWMRYNLTHFYGNNTFGNYFAVWQYRGYPPLSKMVNGTVDKNYSHLDGRRWTAGCHGSVGFLNAVLRVVNIPIQPVWVCEHELPYFMTERMYLDHGDNPYNGNVKDSAEPALSLLIDENTFRSWFTNDLNINITDNGSPACGNVGRRAAVP